MKTVLIQRSTGFADFLVWSGLTSLWLGRGLACCAARGRRAGGAVGVQAARTDGTSRGKGSRSQPRGHGRRRQEWLSSLPCTWGKSTYLRLGRIFANHFYDRTVRFWVVGDEPRVSSFNLGVLRLLLFSQQLFMESLLRAGSHYTNQGASSEEKHENLHRICVLLGSPLLCPALLAPRACTPSRATLSRQLPCVFSQVYRGQSPEQTSYQLQLPNPDD